MHDKQMIERSRSLRKGQTDAEKRLWGAIRNRQVFGYKFRRQYLIKGFIVDFVCLECKLIVEADGGQHQLQETYDQRRTVVLREEGYKVLRFWNNEILANLEGVLQKIMEVLGASPHPNPLPQAGEGA